MRLPIHRRLASWYSRNARALPWRESRDPYLIWISEVMLQQTQVATVVGYFSRFVKRFPTLTKLAAANEASVLRLWEGLGYYRRARNLCSAARQLIQLGHATVPDDPELVEALPGFGRYTTNAVLSQAYDRRVPILEANSTRVLCRLFGIDGDPGKPAVRRLLWRLAEIMLPGREVGDFNQAIMELGALVCTPAEPNCDDCPLAGHCLARQRGQQDEIPHRSRRVEPVKVDDVAVVIRTKGRVLLVQRKDDGRWANLWEMPHQAIETGETAQAAAMRLLAALGIRARVCETITSIRHRVTKFDISMTCLEVSFQSGKVRRGPYREVRWVRLRDLARYPMSTPQRRLARQLQERHL